MAVEDYEGSNPKERAERAEKIYSEFVELNESHQLKKGIDLRLWNNMNSNKECNLAAFI